MPQSIRDVATLRARIEAGMEPTYLLFWGHTGAGGDRVGQECLSQWYPAPFSVDGLTYPSAEHFMMAAKARLFGDDEVVRRVLAAKHPGEAKKLGREVRDFDEALWEERRFEIVVTANRAKFAQHPPLARFLAGTKEKVLVEASPTDTIWGIGLAADDPRATDPAQWRGLNLLGFALMAVRAG